MESTWTARKRETDDSNKSLMTKTEAERIKEKFLPESSEK